MSNARKVHYKSIQRSSKATAHTGVYLVTQKWENGQEDTLGQIHGSRKFAQFSIVTADGEKIDGVFPTLAQAGETLRKLWDSKNKSNDNEAPVAAQESNVELLTLDEAAQKLCGNANNPLAALKKRISRGTVQTRETDNGLMVVLGDEAEAA